MLKAWINLWKNIFCYTGVTSRKEYWLALVFNIIAAYVFVIPFALLAMCITDRVWLVTAVYLIGTHLPVLPLYFRRARDAGWRMGTAVYLALVTPVLSGLLVGFISRCGVIGKGRSFALKTLALGYGLFLYGGILGILLHGDPTSIPALPVAGLLLCTCTLIGYGAVHWREVLAFFGHGAS